MDENWPENAKKKLPEIIEFWVKILQKWIKSAENSS